MKGTEKIIQPETRRYCKGLFYSPAGNGKTRLMASAQDDERTAPMLLLDYEGGTSSLVGIPIDIFPIRSWEDYNEAYKLLSDKQCPYKSVGLDSISETHIMSLMNQLDTSTRTRRIADLLEQGDYGIALVQMRRLLRAFRDLPLHVFASSLAKDDTDPREGTIKKPALAGALADEAPGIFDLVAYLAVTSVDETDDEGNKISVAHRVLILQNYPKMRTKIRVPANLTVPDELWDPSITSLLDTLGFAPAD
jgi:hypothetical protein